MESIESIIDFFHDVIVIVDKKSVITSCNSQVSNLFGYQPDELKGQNLSVLLVHDFSATHQQYVETFFERPKFREPVHGVNIKGRKKNGEEIFLDIALSPYFNQGEVLAIAAIRDATHTTMVKMKYEKLLDAVQMREKSEMNLLSRNQLLQNTLLLHKSVFNSSEDPMAIIDMEFRFSSFNSSYADAFRKTYKIDLEIGMSPVNILKNEAEIQADFIRCWGSADEKARKVKWRWILDDSPEILPTLFRNLYDDEGNKIGVLMQSSRHARTTNDTNDLNLYFEKYFKMNDFMSKVDHDLQSPLNNIASILEMLEINDQFDDDTKLLISKADQSVKILRDYLVEMRTELKTEFRGTQEVDVETVFEDVKVSLGEEIAESGIEISYSGDVKTIRESKWFVYSIFLNLISNAIKYRREEVAPVLDVSVEKASKGVIVTFKDNGIGIDLSSHGSLVFEPGERIGTHDTKGKGMGLFLIKRQLEASHGSMDITSQLNKGTTFRIFIKQHSS